MVVSGLIAGVFVIELVTASVIPLLLWGALVFGTGLLMLEDSTGAVTNNASILTGRRIALTGRGRMQIALDHISPQKRRERWLAFLAMLAIVAVAVILAVTQT